MTAKTCGCSKETCGCCEGTRKLTPASTVNRAGLDALLYRVGTHGTFFETMKARLATITVDAPGADGQTIETFQPLRGLTTRNSSDPAIALLDGWATVGDVLTFYQERIANEGYLRTATERRSVLELARLVGYTLRPGVAATVFLAYTLEDKQAEAVEIPIGARSQSIPGPGELPQSFETSESLIARTEWSNLQVRLRRPQKITFENVLTVEKLYVAGISTNLKTGDLLLLVFGEPGTSVARTVTKAEAQGNFDRTEIQLAPVPLDILATLSALSELVKQIEPLVTIQSSPSTEGVLRRAKRLLTNLYLGLPFPPRMWGRMITNPTPFESESTIDPPVLKAIADFEVKIKDALERPSIVTIPVPTDPSEFVPELLKPRIPQKSSSLQLDRSLKQTFSKDTDAHAQLLVNFAPELKGTFYHAWSNAVVNATPAELEGVYVLRLQAPLFGASVPKQPTYYTGVKSEDDDETHTKGEVKPQSKWKEWGLEGESNNALFLDQAHDEILPSSLVMIQRPVENVIMRDVRRVDDALSTQRTAYGISGKTTVLTFAESWWEIGAEGDIGDTLRRTLVYGQSEKLILVEEPITDPVRLTKEDSANGQGIELAELYDELTSGRWVIFSGERADIPGVTGVKASELLMISGLRQDFDKNLPGDKMHTTLLLATPTAYTYKRDTLTIYGNVVKATHGETRNETLGSGDGSQPLQSFDLQQPPLTFVPAPTPAGVESTLKIYVNDVEWHEADTLAGLKPKDRNFITKTDDNDKTSVIFGNGQQGSRLPTGVLNVKSIYRNGIGKGGNVQAEQISLLQTRPLGVKSVLNPLRASGGADKENRDQARENAPLAVMALDRLVSLRDYADFTRTFAGIAKASGRRLSDRHQEFIHLTIAGADDIPIDPTSDLYRNLLIALRELGDLSVTVRVNSRRLVVLVLSANVRLLPDYQWEPVVTNIRAVLLESFGFQKRALGQAALLCEIIGTIQNVEGVAYVDVDAFGGIPESTDLKELAEAAQKIVATGAGATPTPAQVVTANPAEFVAGVLQAAELAIFIASVPDTLVLNQIK